jgi:hypothetical protein
MALEGTEVEDCVSTGIPGLTVGFVGPASGDLVASAAASSIRHSPLRSS